jgi:8-amino-7-oxononanoate synthase
MGSLSKAIPSNGGFVAARSDVVIFLQHGAGAFMFSAALCPPAVAAARASLRIVRDEPHRLRRLHANAARLRDSLTALGYHTGESASPVIPVIVGTDVEAYRFSRLLFAHGIVANAVVSPAVSSRAARLRLCATAAQDDDLLSRAIAVFRLLRGNGHRPAQKPRDE